MITVRVAGTFLKAETDPALLDRLQPFINAMVPLAEAVRKRVQEHGKVVGDQPTYSTKRGYKANPQYAQQAGAGDGKRQYWPTSQAFHDAASAKAGTGDVTHGMWRGYQVRTYGTNAVVIDFAGTSLGRAAEKGKRGQPLKILNSLKAGTLWTEWNVNVTQPNDDEQEALQMAVLYQAHTALAVAFGVEAGPPPPVAAPALYSAIAQAWITK